MALDAYAADKLLFLNDARLIAVWVTLNTVDQLRDRYRCVGALACALGWCHAMWCCVGWFGVRGRVHQVLRSGQYETP